ASISSLSLDYSKLDTSMASDDPSLSPEQRDSEVVATDSISLESLSSSSTLSNLEPLAAGLYSKEDDTLEEISSVDSMATPRSSSVKPMILFSKS
ncbi:hypothetical protein FCV25MIE_29151, partial [Fagus crenata]